MHQRVNPSIDGVPVEEHQMNMQEAARRETVSDEVDISSLPPITIDLDAAGPTIYYPETNQVIPLSAFETLLSNRRPIVPSAPYSSDRQLFDIVRQRMQEAVDKLKTTQKEADKRLDHYFNELALRRTPDETTQKEADTDEN